jgi:hypothetical protein
MNIDVNLSRQIYVRQRGAGRWESLGTLNNYGHDYRAERTVKGG